MYTVYCSMYMCTLIVSWPRQRAFPRFEYCRTARYLSSSEHHPSLHNRDIDRYI